MIPFRSKRFIILVVAVVAVALLVLPAFVAFRYTAPEQRADFLTHPWRGWSFAYAALAVPSGSELKTSGMALRKADWLYKGTVVDPREVQLLYVAQDEPYMLKHAVGERTVVTAVTPSYCFIWQVAGVVDTIPGERLVTVALMDYETGRMLYDVRDDLTPAQLVGGERVVSPSPTP